MSEDTLLSVGVDLGTSTMQMIVSRLHLQNTAAPFTVPHMEITNREILYRSLVHFTPLLSADTLDADSIGRILRTEYVNAGIEPNQIKTGAVIITGETSRKENARQVLSQLSDLAGEFVVETAGPALESVLAAKGAGADHIARRFGRPVLHIDIGGGTSNMALYDEDGQLCDTGCLNVGGRLMKFDEQGRVIYVSPVLQGMDVPEIGEKTAPEHLKPLLQTMVSVLEQAAGLSSRTTELQRWVTDKLPQLPGQTPVISFSGGVADLIRKDESHWLRYGDLGVLLGGAIARSKLCQADYVLGRETIGATVVGAGSYATELSGSTVSYTAVQFPVHNLPAISLSRREEQLQPNQLAAVIAKKRALHDGPVALTLYGEVSSYADIRRLAQGISAGMSGTNLLAIVLERDVGKALGQALAGAAQSILCLDGLHVPDGSYLDVAQPVGDGASVPVVIKTLAFS
jgi:ethanolamine utilization protein EutA